MESLDRDRKYSPNVERSVHKTEVKILPKDRTKLGY